MIELERLYKWMSHSLAIFIEFLTRAPKTQRKPPSSRLRSDCIFKQFYKFYWQHYCFCHAWGATNQHKWLSAHHRFDKRHLITWYSYYIRCDWTKIQIQNVLKKKCGQKKTPRKCVSFVRARARHSRNTFGSTQAHHPLRSNEVFHLFFIEAIFFEA